MGGGRRAAEEGATRVRGTVAADVDRTRVADELQLRDSRRLRELSGEDELRRRGGGRNGDRDYRAASRCFTLVDVPVLVDIIVVMDSRTVDVITVFRVVRNSMNMKGERLDLERPKR